MTFISCMVFIKCTLTWCRKVPKKVSAVAISRDGHYILAADKFGDINIILTEQGEIQLEIMKR